jgi:hypothetical protein
MKYFLLIFMLCAQLAYANCKDITPSQMAQALNATELAPIISIEAENCRDILIHQHEVGFHLSADTLKMHQGIRSEIALQYPFKEGEKVSYAFELMLPKDFKPDATKNRWWIVAQWHDQPDPRINETWAKFPKNSPPVSIYIEERNGVAGIGIGVLNSRQQAWFPFTLGEWLSVDVSLEWSRQPDGKVTFEVSGHPEMYRELTGVNMHNAYQHYFKLGQYRHPEIKTDNIVYFRNVKIHHAN